MSKTIFIILDGCSFEAATDHLGVAEHLVEAGMGAKYKVLSELPSSSRPLYETLFTGLPVNRHGIYSNLVVKKSTNQNLFQLCKENLLTTAASAYYWVSELYVEAPFDVFRHRIQLDLGAENLISPKSIDYGMYYYEDAYPDSHVFSDGEFLRNSFDPDFLVIHSMNIDDAGHKSATNKREYLESAAKVNLVMSCLLADWIESGYQVVITSDHGMNEYGFHGGNTLDQRLVPLYLFGNRVKKGVFCENTISQLSVAPLLCRLLEIQPSAVMKNLVELGVDFFESEEKK